MSDIEEQVTSLPPLQLKETQENTSRSLANHNVDVVTTEPKQASHEDNNESETATDSKKPSKVCIQSIASTEDCRLVEGRVAGSKLGLMCA